MEPSGTTNVYADTSRAVYALVTDKQTELPQIGVQVKFSVDVIAGTGGHDHHDALRPKGKLLDCRSGSEVETTVFTTQLDGKATVTFSVPQVSGTHNITAVRRRQEMLTGMANFATLCPGHNLPCSELTELKTWKG
ncbi:MAG: hypothetical protein A2Z65_10765 [Gallionellales bacterium RIFCSPLOWO2_02_58_13]|nr:MAG: hypothetical protein A2Z65_10765 [Gallionellales bacterium RIFCSPLOWO2_02_58_13]